MDRAEEVQFAKLHYLIQDLKDYIILFDKTSHGSVCDFLNYYHIICEFHKEMIKVTLNAQTKDDALDVLREKIVRTSRVGKKFVINTDTMVPDFKVQYTSTAENFDTNLVFDRTAWKENKDNYMKIVRQHENHDTMEKLGNYMMHPDFEIVIVSRYQSDA